MGNVERFLASSLIAFIGQVTEHSAVKWPICVYIALFVGHCVSYMYEQFSN